MLVNKDNLETISNKVMNTLNEENMKEVMPNILQMNMNENTIAEIMTSDMSASDKQKTTEIMGKIATTENQNEIFNNQYI